MPPNNQAPQQNYSQYVVEENNDASQNTPAQDKKQPSKISLQGIKDRLLPLLMNPYLWGLLALVIIVVGVIWYVERDREATTTIDGDDFTSSTLDEDGFAELAREQAEIDSTNQTLNVRANSVFDGTMLVRSSLEVQGQLRVGEDLSLNDITVSEQATLNNADVAEDLNVQGSAQLDGATTIQDSLTVNEDLTTAGSGSFGGQLSAETIEAGNLTFSGDLTMSGRVITGGEQTSAVSGGSIGGGGTVSVNGNDTAGSVNINTGNDPSAGTLAEISFGDGYGDTPRVNITPVGSPTGNLDWYVERTTDGFTIGVSSAPSSGSNYTFDYFVVE